MRHFYEIHHHTLTITMSLIGLMILLALSSPITSAQTIAATGESAHYIVFERGANGTLRPVHHSYVAMTLPIMSEAEYSERLTSGQTRNDVTVGVALLDTTNRVSYRSTVSIDPWLRGDFHAAEGSQSIDGVIFPQETAYFVVRVPAQGDTRLLLEGGPLEASAVFDPAAIAMQVGQNLAPETVSTPQLVHNIQNGNPANRVDMLIIGEGYTVAQASKFQQDVNALVSGFFSITPYNEYRNYVNVSSLLLASAQSGADHPPYNAACTQNGTCCGDSAALGDPLAGTMVNTALDAAFCTNNIHRLLTVNNGKALAAAATVPYWDTIMVIVNDPVYGGGGGAIGVFSNEARVVQVAQHEYGHSFTGLADTYETPYPGFPACSDVDANSNNDCEPNVTDDTAQIKWSQWIGPGTPLPTPDNGAYAWNVVGLFEGARFLSSGIYRPTFDSKMRTLESPFAPVESEAYVLNLYNGWGGLADGLDMIEPGTESPSAQAPVMLTVGEAQTFSTAVLGPQAGPAPTVRWSVDGTTVYEGNSNGTTQYTFNAAHPGQYVVRLTVIDGTPLVSNGLRAEVTHRREWRVIVGDGEQPSGVVVFGNDHSYVSEQTGGYMLDLELIVITGNDGATLPGPITITAYQTAGNATYDADYTLPQSITFDQPGGFPAGSYTASLPVMIMDDTLPEVQETAQLSLYVAGANVYAGNTHTISIGMSDVTPEPTDLMVQGDLTQPVVKPTYTWKHQPYPDQYTVPASWYMVALVRNGVSYAEQWYAASEVCVGVDCTAPHPDALLPYGLNNGSYQWWVGAYAEGGAMTWSAGASFMVAVPTPTLPTHITVDPGQGRPTLTWTHDPYALWIQVYIGNKQYSYLEWHEAATLCTDGICTLNPLIDWPGGTYAVWMQAWGAAGFSGINGEATPDSWQQGDDLVLSSLPPGTPTSLAVSDASNPAFTWNAATGATWYELIITPADYAWTYATWYQANDINCANLDATCTVLDPALNSTLANGNYMMYVRAWGPGGFSIGDVDGGYVGAAFNYMP